MADNIDYSKMSDDDLLAEANKGNSPAVQEAGARDYSKMSDEDLLKEVNGNTTTADIVSAKQNQFDQHGGWKSWGKGLLSSVADIPNNVGQGLAYASEKLDDAAGVTPLVTREDVKGNWFDKQARSLEEPNAANYAGRMTGDLAASAVPAATLPKGATTAGKIGYDALSGGLSGLATGGPEGAALGAVTGGLLSGAGRLAGLAPKKAPTEPLMKDLKRVYGSGLAWGVSGIAGSTMGGLGVSIPATLGGAAALPGVYTAFRHVPQGIANGALRYGASALGGVGGGMIHEAYPNLDQPSQDYTPPGERFKNSQLSQNMNNVMDYGTRGGLINSLFRGKGSNGQ